MLSFSALLPQRSRKNLHRTRRSQPTLRNQLILRSQLILQSLLIL